MQLTGSYNGNEMQNTTYVETQLNLKDSKASAAFVFANTVTQVLPIEPKYV